MLEQTFRDWERQIRREEGLEGEIKGEIKGMQKLVLGMPRQRFGPVPQVVSRRVKEISSSKELGELSRCVLTAGSLQETRRG